PWHCLSSTSSYTRLLQAALPVYLFRPGSPLLRAAAVLVVDGAGDTRIVNRAVGSTRLRVTLAGPGGHSWADRGQPNPAHALARGAGEHTAELQSREKLVCRLLLA